MWSLTYKDVSDKALAKMNEKEKLIEIRRAFKFLRKNCIPPKKCDLYRNSGFYKKLQPPFNKGTIERLEWNACVYVYFKDIVQRIVEEDLELTDTRKIARL